MASTRLEEILAAPSIAAGVPTHRHFLARHPLPEQGLADETYSISKASAQTPVIKGNFVSADGVGLYLDLFNRIGMGITGFLVAPEVLTLEGIHILVAVLENGDVVNREDVLSLAIFLGILGTKRVLTLFRDSRLDKAFVITLSRVS